MSGRIAAGEYVQGNPAKVLDQKAVVTRVSGTNDEIVEIAAQTLGLDEADFHPDRPLQELPEWDSLNVLRLLLTLEERLGVKLSENQLFSATRVSEILAIVEGAKMDSDSE